MNIFLGYGRLRLLTAGFACEEGTIHAQRLRNPFAAGADEVTRRGVARGEPIWDRASDLGRYRVAQAGPPPALPNSSNSGTRWVARPSPSSALTKWCDTPSGTSTPSRDLPGVAGVLLDGVLPIDWYDAWYAERLRDDPRSRRHTARSR